MKQNNFDNISDDEIRIINDSSQPRRNPRLGWLWAALGVIACAVILWFALRPDTQPSEEPEQGYFEVSPQPVLKEGRPAERVPFPLGRDGGSLSLVCDSLVTRGFCELRDTTINDVPLQILIPHRAHALLHVGPINHADTTIVYVAQAADIRADNGKILGAFVLAGKPLAWGLSKKGYCAIIDDVVSVGVSENSPLFEEATEKGGYFFRQYPLVTGGQLVENEPKNKSERRAICQRKGETFMVHTLSKESFHDFAQALADLGCDNAVSLVGSFAYGWYVDAACQKVEWGEPIKGRIPQNTSYLVWRKF